MATEQSSTDSIPKKRQRRVKQDPQFEFENPNVEPQPTTTTTTPNHEDSTGADLYEPGDIVWSKLGSFPWWPALIYRCDAEDGMYTRTLKSNNKTKRQYFVYFYGKYLEYSWLSTRSLLKYAGLNDFIQNAEAAVQKASTKYEKIELANRFQLKVSVKKRVQWDEAIDLADKALNMTKEERIKQFSDLLNDAQITKNRSKNSRKSSIDKTDDIKKLRNRSPSFDLPTAQTIAENGNKNEVQPSIKKKRGRKPKIDHSPTDLTIKNEQKKPSSSLFNYPNIPPLSNYEQKQIAEGLLNHPNGISLTFEEGQSFALNKAREIVNENYNFSIGNITPEWFYDFILLKHPSVVFKYRSWFDHIKPDVIPDGTDLIQLKQWQIALMIEAQAKAENSSSD